MTNRKLKNTINIAILAAAVLIYFGMRYLPHQRSSSPNNGLVFVSRAIDGDTIKLSNGEYVRLIGIDTPESRYNKKIVRDSKRSGNDINSIIRMGREASDFIERKVEGKMVRLEFDVERRDKYGRLLAYVYLEDGTFVNAKIIEEGYAQIMTIPPNIKHAGYFLKLQKEAREKNKGLWGTSAEWMR